MKVKLTVTVLFIIFFNYSYSQDLQSLSLKEVKLEEIKIEKTNLSTNNLSAFVYKYRLCFINQIGEKIIIEKTAGNIGYSTKRKSNGDIDAIHFSPEIGIHSGFNDDTSVESVVVGYVYDFKLTRNDSEVNIFESGVYESSLIKINDIYYFIERINFIETE